MAVRIPSPNRDVLEKFFSRVVRDGDCWRWTGAVNRKGYGVTHNTSAHRIPYAWFVEPIPPGYHVDHLCRNPWCVNPAHCEAVTLQENHRRGDVLRTHCKSGRHPITERWYRGTPWETCSQCRLESRERWLNKVRQWRVKRDAA